MRVRILANSLASDDVGITCTPAMPDIRMSLPAGRGRTARNEQKLTRDQRKEKKGTEGSSKASLHAKSFVYDRTRVFIGSLNLDPRAVIHNTEIGVV